METWCGHEIGASKEKFRNAFACKPVTEAAALPVMVNTPPYFGFGSERPANYWTDPAVMLDIQQRGYEEHFRRVHDDTVPYFMPWFGTGVLASAFGCAMKEATGHGDDPACLDPIIREPEDMKKLHLPDPNRDGWMPRVLACMDYARTHGDLAVGPTDLNSPLCTTAQLCGYDNLFVWMYEEPALVHDLMGMVTEAFIAWVKLQKQVAGEELTSSHGLQGVWSPEGVGVWVSDDDLVSLGPDQYEEFVVPCYSEVFTTFGGGSLHYCGKGNHQLENFRKIKGLRAINNSVLGKFDVFAELVRRRPAGVMIQIQDSAPLDPEAYFGALFDAVDDLSGLMVATWAPETIALMQDGGYKAVAWDPYDAANRTVDAVRKAVARKLGQ